MRRKGTRHQPGSAHGPRGSQGPLGIPPGHPRRWFRFGTFSYERAQAHGGYLHPRAKAVVFHAQGRSRGAWGRKGAVQGPPVGQKKKAEMAPNLNQRQGWPGQMPKGPGEPRGPGAEPN